MDKLKGFMVWTGQLIIAVGSISAGVFLLSVFAKVLYKIFLIGWNLW